MNPAPQLTEKRAIQFVRSLDVDYRDRHGKNLSGCQRLVRRLSPRERGRRAALLGLYYDRIDYGDDPIPWRRYARGVREGNEERGL